MIAISAAWLDAGRDRPKLEKLPLLSSLLPTLDSAHKALLTLRQPVADASPELRRRIEEQDRIHDAKARGSHGLLTALAELAGTEAESDELLALRDRLLPRGLSTVRLGYREEAGNAEAVRQYLAGSSKDRATLRKIKTLSGRTLEDEIDAYLSAGLALGRLEDERASLDRSGSAPGELQRARNAWIRAVRAVDANLDLDASADDALRAQLLGPLHDAEARADRRRSAGPDDPQPPAPGPAPGPVPPADPPRS